MPNVALEHFLDANRQEIIVRCQAKETHRSDATAFVAKIDAGIPLFLDQLIEELRSGPTNAEEISKGAIKHGRDLLSRGFTVGQVVHGYGDVCQSVTDLAVEREAPISTSDFRTLNRCLDDAIAGAVTEYARGQDATADGESRELRRVAQTALTAFEAIQSGSVGVRGGTGNLLHRSLTSLIAIIDRPPAEKR